MVMIPEFAVVGHPNEGKSSVLSTLAEDDSVNISPIPGETVVCQSFPVCIDGIEIIRFIDTPGFQNPRKTLHILQSYNIDSKDVFNRFQNDNIHDQSLRDDCELLQPIINGAGIIYVVDASRPIRNIDKAEIEILRLTGQPRMAIINSKEDDQQYIDQWRGVFRRNFNSTWIFNAHKATYKERIELLTALKHIDQQWLEPLEKVIAAFEKNWQGRTAQTVNLIYNMITECVPYQVMSSGHSRINNSGKLRENLFDQYKKSIKLSEQNCYYKIRQLFKHNIFQPQLPEQSILNSELFSDLTWEFLGLDKTKLVMCGGLSGAAIGAGLDLAAGGLAFGVFSTVGGIVGALTTLKSRESLFRNRSVFGIPLSRERIQIGPHQNVQFLFILLDRALIYYTHAINWAHGRRDIKVKKIDMLGVSNTFSAKQQNVCLSFFNQIISGNNTCKDITESDFKQVIKDQLNIITHHSGE